MLRPSPPFERVEDDQRRPLLGSPPERVGNVDEPSGSSPVARKSSQPVCVGVGDRLSPRPLPDAPIRFFHVFDREQFARPPRPAVSLKSLLQICSGLDPLGCPQHEPKCSEQIGNQERSFDSRIPLHPRADSP